MPSSTCVFVPPSCVCLARSVSWAGRRRRAAGQIAARNRSESIVVVPGFTVELVATEPLVKDPIAFEWGADGKLWVVEMGDYPLGVDGKGKPGGVVRFLEDTDGDGRYDKQTTFLEVAWFPTGVMPWRRRSGRVRSRYLLCRGSRRRRQGRPSRGSVHGLRTGKPAAPVERLRDGPGRLGLWRQRRQRRQVRSLKKGKATSISGRDFRFRPEQANLRPRAAGPRWPPPRRLGPLVWQQQPQLGLALRPRQSRPQAQSVFAPPDPRQTLEPATRLIRPAALSRGLTIRRGQPRHVGQ